MKTNRAVRWWVRVRVIVTVVAVVALGAIEVRAACQWYRAVGAGASPLPVVPTACTTDLGAAVMWGINR